MMRDDEPMTSLSADEWRQYKRATRRLLHSQRLARVDEAKPTAFLQAVERDDVTDPYEELAAVQRQAA